MIVQEIDEESVIDSVYDSLAEQFYIHGFRNCKIKIIKKYIQRKGSRI